MIDFLSVFFPILMVIGALGSMVVSMIGKRPDATTLQWLGACLLYTALTIRNVKG